MLQWKFDTMITPDSSLAVYQRFGAPVLMVDFIGDELEKIFNIALDGQKLHEPVNWQRFGDPQLVLDPSTARSEDIRRISETCFKRFDGTRLSQASISFSSDKDQ